MRMLINGDWVDAEDKGTIEVVNAANGELIETVPSATLSDVNRAVEVACEGREIMARTTAHERFEFLRRSAELIRKDADELAVLLATENGKPIRQTRVEIEVTARLLGDFGEEAKRIRGETFTMDEVPGCEGQIAMTFHEPLGTVAAICPFNYPAELFAHKAGPALAAGNALITKPPTDCPLTLLRIGELMIEAGVPPKGYQMLTGPGSVVGMELARSPEVAMISFTGHTDTGKAIMAEAAKLLKRVSFELGGNDPILVFDDADIDQATEAVVDGRLGRGNGQICCAVKRIITQDTVAPQFTEMLVEKTKRLKMGDQLQEDTDVGPLTSEEAAIRVEQSIKKTIEEGAKCLVGGTRVNGTFIEPTILVDVTPAMTVARQEVFGPVAPIMTFATEEQAIDIANDTIYGLQAGVFTKDVTRAFRVARQLEAGGVVVNWGTCWRPGNVPFGGYKQSGLGREGVYHTIEEMTELKTIILNMVERYSDSHQG